MENQIASMKSLGGACVRHDVGQPGRSHHFPTPQPSISPIFPDQKVRRGKILFLVSGKKTIVINHLISSQISSSSRTTDC